MTYRKAVFIGSSVLLLVVLLYMSQSTSSVKDIEETTVQYSEELGWINWDHARPDGPAKAFKRLMRLSEKATDSFAFSYSQEMALRLVAGEYVAKAEQRWMIPPKLSRTEQEQVFAKIFGSVSTQFEEMQGKGMYQGLGASRNSSFKEGDLMGNLLALHAVFRHYSQTYYKKRLELYSPEENLERYLDKGIGVVKWGEVKLPEDPEATFLLEMQELLYQVRANTKRARMLSAEEQFFKR